MNKQKIRKTKATKRLERLRRGDTFRIPLFDDDGSPAADNWQRNVTEAFAIYMTRVIMDLLGGPDKDDPDPFETRDKTYDLGRIAWNAVTDSDSLDEAKKHLTEMDKLSVPAEGIADLKELLGAMMELRWKLYPGMDAYVDEIEFTELSPGTWDFGITVSKRM